MRNNNCINADRLEYMYPSGSALCGNWTLDEIKTNYSFTQLLKNETGASGVIIRDQNVQVVYGLQVTNIRKAVDRYLGRAGQE